MKLSKDSRKLSKSIFRSSFSDGVLDGKKVRDFADAIINEKPRQYVGVLKEFTRLVRLEESKHHATVEAAMELDASERESLTRAIREKFGVGITTEFKVQPALIGGVRIQIGSDVFDASVRNRLDRLSIELAA